MSKKIVRFIFLLVGLVLLSWHFQSCERQHDDVLVDNVDYVEISFGSHNLRMDLWQPNIIHPNDIRVVIFVHGGSWYSGDKSLWKQEYASNFAIDNICTASINYRLVPEAFINDQLDDLREGITAIRDFIYTKYNSYPKIYLAGHSAGAHLVALYSANINYPKEGLRGIICMDAGEYLTELPEDMDISRDYYKQIRDAFYKAAGNDQSENVVPYLEFLRAETILPILLIYQEDDNYRNRPNCKLYDLLTKLNCDVTSLPVRGINHNAVCYKLAVRSSVIYQNVKSFALNH